MINTEDSGDYSDSYTDYGKWVKLYTENSLLTYYYIRQKVLCRNKTVKLLVNVNIKMHNYFNIEMYKNY